jgi:riboflavin biosynthesis pyrimidine reductase
MEGMMKRPYVTILVSASLDGRVALGPHRTQWEEMEDPRNALFSESPEIWADVEKRLTQTHQPQVHLQGSGSFVKAGQELSPLPAYEGEITALQEDFLPQEVVDDPEHTTWLTVVDGRGRMRSGYKGRDTPGCHMLHLVSKGSPADYLAFLRREKIPYLIAGEKRVDLQRVLEKMNTKLEVDCVMSMAGGKLNGALLRGGLVDEVNLIFRPELIGGMDTPALFDSPDLKADEWPTPLELVTAQVWPKGFLWVRYKIKKDLKPGANSG